MKPTKTLCFVVRSFPQVSETFVVSHVVGAIAMGFDVNVLTERLMSFDQSSQQELLDKYNLRSKVFQQKHSIPRNKLKRAVFTLFYVLKYFPFLVRYKKVSLYERFFILPFKFVFFEPFQRVNLFHMHFANSVPDLVLMKACGFLKGHLVTTFHGYDAHFKDTSELEYLKKKYKTLLKESLLFTVNTPYLANQVRALGVHEEQLKVIPMGVNVHFFVPKQNPISVTNDFVELLSVGRLVGWKGHRLGILAVHELLQKGYPVRYTIIGEGPERDSLEALIAELGLKKQVQLMGAKTQDEIRQQMQHSDIFLMTSYYDETGRRETQGVVTGEAQACGLPVVAFNSGGVPYTLKDGHTGFLCEEGNYLAMAQKIEILLNDTELRRNMGKQAVDFIRQNFSLEVLAEQWKAIYNFNTYKS